MLARIQAELVRLDHVMSCTMIYCDGCDGVNFSCFLRLTFRGLSNSIILMPVASWLVDQMVLGLLQYVLVHITICWCDNYTTFSKMWLMVN